MTDYFKEIITHIKEVEREMGNHYKENIYQYSLYNELNINGIMCQTEVMVPIMYKFFYVGFERADIVIYDNERPTFIIELKSQNQRIGPKEINQLKKYMNNLKCTQAILVNFYETLEIITVNDGLCQKI